MLIRVGIVQNESWIITTKLILVISNTLIDLFTDIKDAGSKDEKMSIIMQNMDLPFNALKALSLHNLMFYSKILSHQVVEIGCKI